MRKTRREYERIRLLILELAVGPSVESALKRVLNKYPYAAHAYLFDKDSGATLVSQPSLMGDPGFHEERNKLQTSLTGWFNLEGKEIVEKMWKMNKQDGRPYMFDYVWAEHGNKREYRSIVLFPLANVPDARKPGFLCDGLNFG